MDSKYQTSGYEQFFAILNCDMMYNNNNHYTKYNNSHHIDYRHNVLPFIDKLTSTQFTSTPFRSYIKSLYTAIYTQIEFIQQIYDCAQQYDVHTNTTSDEWYNHIDILIRFLQLIINNNIDDASINTIIHNIYKRLIQLVNKWNGTVPIDNKHMQRITRALKRIEGCLEIPDNNTSTQHHIYHH